jgi:response regulator NasT
MENPSIQEKLRVMLVDDSESRSLVVRVMLESLGYLVVAEIFEPRLLYDAVRRHQPDVIIIDTDSPTRDTLEHVAMLSEREPRPIVMFSADRDQQTIRAAVHAGASAYVVDGLAAERVEPVIAAAIARFESFQAVRRELAQVRTKLSERKLVERAKGVLMKARGMSEDEAYVALRSMAMERSISVGELARQLLSVSSLLV